MFSIPDFSRNIISKSRYLDKVNFYQVHSCLHYVQELIMFIVSYSVLLFLTATINCFNIPFIQNVMLIPRNYSNITTITNETCQQCLCRTISSFAALNCFPNNTCQLFSTFPIRYKVRSEPQARLYFPQGIIPNASLCCMPNLTSVLEKLKNGTWTYVNISNARNLLIDDKGYLITVELNPPKLDRFDAQTLVLINRTSISGSNARVVGYSNNYYFAGLANGSIAIIDSANLTTVNTINSINTVGVGGIIFLNNGRTMIATSSSNQAIAFFNQTGNSSSDYTFAYRQTVNYSAAHGLTSCSDKQFYTTSWDNNAVYSYNAVENSSLWTEQLLVNASSIGNGGSYMVIDECGRYWFSVFTSTIYIFDEVGSLIGNLSLGTGSIFGITMTDDYVIYLSDLNASWKRILRIDPNIQC